MKKRTFEIIKTIWIMVRLPQEWQQLRRYQNENFFALEWKFGLFVAWAEGDPCQAKPSWMREEHELKYSQDWRWPKSRKESPKPAKNIFFSDRPPHETRRLNMQSQGAPWSIYMSQKSINNHERNHTWSKLRKVVCTAIGNYRRL